MTDTFIGNDYTSKAPFIQSSIIQEMLIKHLLCDWLMLGGAGDTLVRKTALALPPQDFQSSGGTDLSTNSND